VAFQGPLNAHLFVSSTTGDGMLSVSVEDVDPKGKVTRITGGWQTIGLAKLDRSRSRYLDGELIQPYYPFTKSSYARAKPGQVVPVDVEIFPTAASIQPGHRLRVAIQAFDVPHLLPNLQLAAGTAGVLSVRTGTKYPSSMTVPAIR
jgi:predicted acyl esterase